jgi:hypothetical protein
MSLGPEGEPQGQEAESPEQTFHCGRCGRVVDETGLQHFTDSGEPLQVENEISPMPVADSWPTEETPGRTPPANHGAIAVNLPRRGI